MKLRRNQWLRPFQLQKIQQRKLQRIIKYAYDNVEFYHERFKASGISPEDIKTIEDLPKIPVTTKLDVRNGYRSGKIFSPDINLSNCLHSKTGGSSGEPLTTVYDEKAEDFQKAVAVRSFMEVGIGSRDKWVTITTPERVKIQKKWFQRLRFFSPIYLSVFDPVEVHISALKTLQPDALLSYTSSLWILANAIRQKNIDYIRPKVVCSSAEVLTDRTRHFINETFNVETFDLFGCAEVGRSAWECEEHNGYHTDVDALAMEFVKDNEPVTSGEKGRLLYTSLYNYAMPLIRYDVGDICIPTDELCPCGRGLPLIKHIEGRMDDIFVTPDGRFLSPNVFGIIMREIPGIFQYRLIQKTRNKVVVQIVKDYDFSPDAIIQAQNGLKGVLGDDVEIEIELVDEIPKDKTGKLRFFISKVRVDW